MQQRPEFDPMLFVADNRILPQHVAFKHKENDTIWIHPDDLTPEREMFLDAKLERLCSIESPSYMADPVRSTYVNAIKSMTATDPADVNLQVAPQRERSFYENQYDFPLSHIVRNEPPPPAMGKDEFLQLREATKIYLMLELHLNDKGYPNIINEAVDSLKSRGVSTPNTEQLFNELHNALDVSTTDIARAIGKGGANGFGALMGFDPALKAEIDALVDYTQHRGFPLNDVTNWMYGRSQSGMEYASVEDKVAVGVGVQAQKLKQHYRNELATFGGVPDERGNERIMAAAFRNMPTVVAETFFEEGGEVIYTSNPSLYGLLGQAATGYHITHTSPSNPDNQVHQVFVSQELGLPSNTKTLVHEIHHLLYPEHISMESAYHADITLQRDEDRLMALKELADAYVTGDAATRASVVHTLRSEPFSVDGVSFDQALDGVSMQTFCGAVNQAYHYLQMESPTYQRIPTYAQPRDRYLEVIPRYAEMRFVDHVDEPAMMEFIAPGITDIYENLFVPHLELRLEHLHDIRPSKADNIRHWLNGNVSEMDNALYPQQSLAARAAEASMQTPSHEAVGAQDSAAPAQLWQDRVGGTAIPASMMARTTGQTPAMANQDMIKVFQPEADTQVPSTAINGYTVEPHGQVEQNAIRML